MCLGWHRLTSMQLLVSKIPWFSNFFLFFSFILGERVSNQLLIEENWSILEIEKNCISVFIFINITSLYSSVCMLLIKNVSVQAMLMCIHLFNSALNWSVLLLLVGVFCLLFLVWFFLLRYYDSCTYYRRKKYNLSSFMQTSTFSWIRLVLEGHQTKRIWHCPG